VLKNIRKYSEVNAIGKGTLEVPLIFEYTKELEQRFDAVEGEWASMSHIKVERKNWSTDRVVAEAEVFAN